MIDRWSKWPNGELSEDYYILLLSNRCIKYYTYIDNFQNVQTSWNWICFMQKVQLNARLWLKDINSKIGIVITTNPQGMSIVNCYSIVLYGSYPTQCSWPCRAGRNGKDSVALVLYNSYNLRTGEPEVKAVVTSTDRCRLAMLNVFLRESDL